MQLIALKLTKRQQCLKTVHCEGCRWGLVRLGKKPNIWRFCLKKWNTGCFDRSSFTLERLSCAALKSRCWACFYLLLFALEFLLTQRGDHQRAHKFPQNTERKAPSSSKFDNETVTVTVVILLSSTARFCYQNTLWIHWLKNEMRNPSCSAQLSSHSQASVLCTRSTRRTSTSCNRPAGWHTDDVMALRNISPIVWCFPCTSVLLKLGRLIHEHPDYGYLIRSLQFWAKLARMTVGRNSVTNSNSINVHGDQRSTVYNTYIYVPRVCTHTVYVRTCDIDSCRAPRHTYVCTCMYSIKTPSRPCVPICSPHRYKQDHRTTRPVWQRDCDKSTFFLIRRSLNLYKTRPSKTSPALWQLDLWDKSILVNSTAPHSITWRKSAPRSFLSYFIY